MRMTVWRRNGGVEGDLIGCIFFVYVCERAVSYREILCSLASLAGLRVRQAGNLEQSVQPSPVPFRFTCWKGVGPLGSWAGQVQGRAGIPRYPQRPQVVPNRISHPLHAGGSERALSGCFCHCLLVSQCVSLCQMLARKPNLYPCRAAIHVGSLSFKPSRQLPSTAPRFTKLSARLVRHGESHCLP